MSRGKYSPTWKQKECKFNCYGQAPIEYTQEMKDSGVFYDEKTMFDYYDDEGYDSYGYSAFNKNGDYVGVGNGVDRAGFTEDEYLAMSDEEFYNL